MFNATQTHPSFRAEAHGDARKAFPWKVEFRRLFNMRDSLGPSRISRQQMSDEQKEQNDGGTEEIYVPARAQFIAYTDPSSAQRVNALDNLRQKVHEYLDVGTPEAMKVMQSHVQEALEASEFSKGYQMGWWHYAVEEQYRVVLEALQVVAESQPMSINANAAQVCSPPPCLSYETSTHTALISSEIGPFAGPTKMGHSLAVPTTTEVIDWRTTMFFTCLDEVRPLLELVAKSVPPRYAKNSVVMPLLKQWESKVGFEAKTDWPQHPVKDYQELAQICRGLQDAKVQSGIWRLWKRRVRDPSEGSNRDRRNAAEVQVLRNGLEFLRIAAELMAHENVDDVSTQAPSSVVTSGAKSARGDSAFVQTSMAYSDFQGSLRSLETPESTLH